MPEDQVAKKLIKKLEKDKDFMNLPDKLRGIIESQLENSMATVPIPVITIKENDWVIASTPFIDLCAQGRTEEEAIEDLKSMIDDYMKDPDTVKPNIEIKAAVNMHVGVTNVPIKMPVYNKLGDGFNSGQNSPITTE